MSIFIEITNKELNKSDVSIINSIEKGVEKYVLVRDCWIEDLDISTTNPNVIVQSCYFVNSNFVAPESVLLKSSDNYFKGNYYRNPIAKAVKHIGYYNAITA